jgi:hypothetical protein
MRIPSLVLVAALAILAVAAAGSGERVPLVVVSIDGLSPRDVLDAEHRGLHLPNLQRLQREGSYAEAVTAEAPAVTYPSHTTLVTGVSPQRHGITHNRPFDPLGRNADGWFWYAEDIRSDTLWDAAGRDGLKTAAVDWPVTVAAGIHFNIAQYWMSRDPDATDAIKLTRALSTKGLLAEVERAVGAYPHGAASDWAADERRAAVSAYLLERKRPGLHLAYLSSLDDVAHKTGPDSPAARRALERIDALIGRLRSAAERAYAGRVSVAVVSDHGFTRTDRELDLNQLLHRAGLLQLDDTGRVRGWRAFAWGQGGSASIVLRDPEDRNARSRIAAELTQLLEAPDSPLESVVEASADARAAGSPGVAFTVFLRLDTRLVDGRAGFVVRTAEPAGDHGHHPSNSEMDATFIVAGPGIPAGSLGRIDMRDVAPTLAGLLGARLKQAEGRDRLATRTIARLGT